ncbi:MAG: hypothetical protein AAFU03_18920, partial [Bacteroidota bacterium]
ADLSQALQDTALALRQTVANIWGQTKPYQIAKAQPVVGLNINVAALTDMDFAAPTRLDGDWSFDGATDVFTCTCVPDHVDLKVNIKVSIANGSSVQRPVQVVEIVRISDGKIMASAATGYIRDASDHEEASYNFSVVDESPGVNPAYKITYIKEGSNSGVVTIDDTKSSFSLTAWQ